MPMKTRGKRTDPQDGKQVNTSKDAKATPDPTVQSEDDITDKVLKSPASVLVTEEASSSPQQDRAAGTSTSNRQKLQNTGPPKRRKVIGIEATNSSSSDDESSTSARDSPTPSSQEERRKKRKCTMVFDEDECVCYPASGNKVPILAVNAVISIDGTTSDGGYIFKFLNKDGPMFRMKLFTPDMGDTKALIKKIQAHVVHSGIRWLYLRDLDVGDKRAVIGLFMHEMSEKYRSLPAEDRFEILCASNLGFFVHEEKKLFLVSDLIQYDLTTMERLPLESTIFIEGSGIDSVAFKLETVTLDESSKAQKSVNQAMMEYFDENQLIVFRAGILFAFIGPYLRKLGLVPSLPLVVAFGPNNCGKTDRSQLYSATCGVLGGKSKKSTAKGILEMMGESSLSFIPLDDPSKAVLEDVIEHGFDGSDVTKVRGNKTITMKILRNVFATCKVAAFDQNHHTKMIFTPEEPVEQERLDSKRDLKVTVERLSYTVAPKAVLHNLQYCELYAKSFIDDQGKYCK